MPDADGYPTEEELARLEAWPVPSEDAPAAARAWLAYIRTLWHWPEWGWPPPVMDRDTGAEFHHVSTGGWSGNEELIGMMESHMLWRMVFRSVHRGGHYLFVVERV